MNRIVAIFQARVGSTRLPGKVLLPIAGKTLLEHVIERVSRSQFINHVVVATSTKEPDQAIIAVANRCGVGGFAGSEEDVLDRFYQAAGQFQAKIIVRITADDPFKDPEVIDKVIGCYLGFKGDIDYVSNTIKPTYPLGLDAEVFSFTALEKAWRETKEPYDREHVTPYLYRHPEIFKLANVENDEDLSHLRWTLDTEADLKFIQEIYKRLYREGRIFLMKDILALLRAEPELARINQNTEDWK